MMEKLSSWLRLGDPCMRSLSNALGVGPEIRRTLAGWVSDATLSEEQHIAKELRILKNKHT